MALYPLPSCVTPFPLGAIHQPPLNPNYVALALFLQKPKGSFGLVFFAKKKSNPDDLFSDETSNPPLAVKMIEKVRLVSTFQMFNAVREKQIMQLLTHPHIARLHGTFSDADCLYYVLEYLAGGNVYHWLWQARLQFDIERVRIYAACVADRSVRAI